MSKTKLPLLDATSNNTSMVTFSGYIFCSGHNVMLLVKIKWP